jgi:hypothetical protein
LPSLLKEKRRVLIVLVWDGVGDRLRRRVQVPGSTMPGNGV